MNPNLKWRSRGRCCESPLLACQAVDLPVDQCLDLGTNLRLVETGLRGERGLDALHLRIDAERLRKLARHRRRLLAGEGGDHALG